MDHTSRIWTLALAVMATLLTVVPIATAQETSSGGSFIDDDATIYEASIEALARTASPTAIRPTDIAHRRQ